MVSFPPESPGDCFTVGQLFSAKVFDHNYQFMISVIPIIIMIIIIKMMPPPRKVTRIGWLAAGCSKRRRSAARKSPLSYHPAGSNRFQDHHQVFQYHDVPNSSSDLLLDNKQTPLIFPSEYIFNSHSMLRRSGPGHMLLLLFQYQKI